MYLFIFIDSICYTFFFLINIENQVIENIDRLQEQTFWMQKFYKIYLTNI